MKDKNTVGVIIGRFQDETLHVGHMYLIDKIKRLHENVLIILGETRSQPSMRNPMRFEARYHMIREKYNDVAITMVHDEKDDDIWSKEVDNVIEREFENTEAIIYGSRDNSLKQYSGRHKVKILEFIGNYSGTEHRKKLEELPQSRDYRRGLILATQNRFPTSYQTVDIVVYRIINEELQILLGKKFNSTEFCLPGGFVDPSDDSLESAALRELKEETTSSGFLYECSNLEYICSKRINDWRYIKDEDKVMTALFATRYIFGPYTANDDLECVMFLPINKLDEFKLNKDHIELIESFKKYFKNQNK